MPRYYYLWIRRSNQKAHSVIIYSSTKAKFRDDVMTNNIGGIIYEAYIATTGGWLAGVQEYLANNH